MYSIDEVMESPDGIPFKADARSFDSNSRASNPYQSLPSPSTRATSVQSSTSNMANVWGIPAAPAPDANPRPKQRQMRRFLSGAGSLKPLILPTTAIAPSPPSSPLDRSPPAELARGLSQTSADTSYRSSPAEPARHFSHTFVDPTAALLSERLPSSPLSMRSPYHCPRSSLVAHEEALQALEGRIRRLERGSSAAAANGDEEVGLGIATATPDDSTPQACRNRRVRPRSLQEELENLRLDAEQPFEDGLIAVDAEATDTQSECIPIGIDEVLASQPVSPKNTTFSEHVRPSAKSEITPEPARPERGTSPDRVKPVPLPRLLPADPAHSLFNRLTTLVSSTKQEPVTLARRLLWNAWVLGSASFGGVGWWLLGLAFRPTPSERDKHRETDDTIAGEGPSTRNKGNWKQYSMQARRQYHERCPTDAETSLGDSRTQTMPPGNRLSLLDEPHVFPCGSCKEPSTRQTMRLWLRFSLTVILAVGVAIKHGPGMILDHPPIPLSPPPPYCPQAEGPDEINNNASNSEHRASDGTTKKPRRAC